MGSQGLKESSLFPLASLIKAQPYHPRQVKRSRTRQVWIPKKLLAAQSSRIYIWIPKQCPHATPSSPVNHQQAYKKKTEPAPRVLVSVQAARKGGVTTTLIWKPKSTLTDQPLQTPTIQKCWEPSPRIMSRACALQVKLHGESSCQPLPR